MLEWKRENLLKSSSVYIHHYAYTHVSVDRKKFSSLRNIFASWVKKKNNSFWEQSESEMKDVLNFSVASKAEYEKTRFIIHIYCSQT